MIHEYELFLCIDAGTHRPYLAKATGDGGTEVVDLEALLSSDLQGAGPFPVVVKADDFRMEMDLKDLYNKHLTCAARKKRMTFRDSSGRSLRFLRQINSPAYPYAMVRCGEDGTEDIVCFSVTGECDTGLDGDRLMEYTIVKQ